MMKNILNLCTVVAFCIVPVSAQAARCKQGDLMVDFVQVQTFAPEDMYTANIIGTLDMPNPNYSYTLEFPSPSADFKAGTMLRGALKLYETNPDMMSIQVITPITIENMIKIPFDATGIFIDVSKPFSGQPEYFTVKFVETFNGTKSLCMPPEMYK
ncbi:MAG: hypothetical protein COB36_05485 [Alphaproteobacteria bacterium]|nr:MAG: hypothetical protein COB36_05485 [Alphaproteobacteria bacterium]